MSKLRIINFGDAKITNIDNFAFRYCELLSSINISETVEYIGRYAFYGCKSLVAVTVSTVPNFVETIGDFAFDGCKRLRTVISHIPAESLPTLNNNVFDNIAPDCVLYVPKGAKAVYKNTHGWSIFENIVEM